MYQAVFGGVVQVRDQIFWENILLRLYRQWISLLVRVMRDTTYHFEGRGKGTDSNLEPYRFIQCTDGTVMAIIIACHGV
jgi:hypothetical protein